MITRKYKYIIKNVHDVKGNKHDLKVKIEVDLGLLMLFKPRLKKYIFKEVEHCIRKAYHFTEISKTYELANYWVNKNLAMYHDIIINDFSINEIYPMD